MWDAGERNQEKNISESNIIIRKREGLLLSFLYIRIIFFRDLNSESFGDEFSEIEMILKKPDNLIDIRQANSFVNK